MRRKIIFSLCVLFLSFSLFGRERVGQYISFDVFSKSQWQKSDIFSTFLLGGGGEFRYGGGKYNKYTFYGSVNFSFNEELYEKNMFRKQGNNFSFSLGGGGCLYFSKFSILNTLLFGLEMDNAFSSLLTPSFSLLVSLEIVPGYMIFSKDGFTAFLSLPISLSWKSGGMFILSSSFGFTFIFAAGEENEN